MPKYLFEADYSTEGIQGVLSKGGTARKAAVQAAAKGLGGKMESFYFAFGGTDAFTVVELPDNTAAAALAMTASASGAVSVRTTVLLSVEEVDAAAKAEVKYKRPGG